MKSAFLLDTDIFFTHHLKRLLQMRFPQYHWQACDKLSNLHALVHESRDNPAVCLYNRDDFPNWSPPWPDCMAIALRNESELGEIFPDIQPDEQQVLWLRENLVGKAINRLDFAGIFAKIQHLLPFTSENPLDSCCKTGLVCCVESYLRGDRADACLRELMEKNGLHGMHSYYLPLVESTRLQSVHVSNSDDKPGECKAESPSLDQFIENLQACEKNVALFSPTPVPNCFAISLQVGHVYRSELNKVRIHHLCHALSRYLRSQEAPCHALIHCPSLSTELACAFAAAADTYFLIGSSKAFRNPAHQRHIRAVREALGPGRQMYEHCVADPELKQNRPVQIRRQVLRS